MNAALGTVLEVKTVCMEVGRLIGHRWPKGSSGFRLMERVSHQANAQKASTITRIRASQVMGQSVSAEA